MSLRFVVVATMREGSLAEPRMLDDANQEAACTRYCADTEQAVGMGEIVVWLDGLPKVARSRATAGRAPHVSASVLRQLRGAELAADEDWVRLKERRARGRGACGAAWGREAGKR